MEQGLMNNDYKGHWNYSSIGNLLAKLYEEIDELREAYDESKDLSEVVSEAADVANLALMVADNYRRIHNSRRGLNKTTFEDIDNIRAANDLVRADDVPAPEGFVAYRRRNPVPARGFELAANEYGAYAARNEPPQAPEVIHNVQGVIVGRMDNVVPEQPALDIGDDNGDDYAPQPPVGAMPRDGYNEAIVYDPVVARNPAGEEVDAYRARVPHRIPAPVLAEDIIDGRIVRHPVIAPIRRNNAHAIPADVLQALRAEVQTVVNDAVARLEIDGVQATTAALTAAQAEHILLNINIPPEVVQ